MLCRKFKHLLLPGNLSKKSLCQCLSISKLYTKRYTWINKCLFRSDKLSLGMSSPLRFKYIIRDLSVVRLWSAWRRSCFVNSVVKRCRSEYGLREVLYRFRQTFRPRCTLVLSAAAAYRSGRNDDDTPEPECINSITDEDMQALMEELTNVEELAKKTLYCEACDKRIIIDKKHPGVLYCVCPHHHTSLSSLDGWVPYMEANDVIVWRKEYKPGQGLYAYKVYGRYSEVRAADFAAVQVDGAYRRAWDSAVAALSVVERRANGLADQAVLHWEVLWPRLFANRDYVYIRRHKEFQIKSKCMSHKDGLFEGAVNKCQPKLPEEKPNVHSRAKRKVLENEQREREREASDKEHNRTNKVYVIVSKSCTHPQVPETKRAIRVTEYWSHMVIQTLYGPDKLGMEFVLTYYDEPGVGGMPRGVSAWAAGRAAPAFLAAMRTAADNYRRWAENNNKDAPDFTPFGPENVSFHGSNDKTGVREEDMESSQQGPDIETETPTEVKTDTEHKAEAEKVKPVDVKVVYTAADKSTQTDSEACSTNNLDKMMQLVDHNAKTDAEVQTTTDNDETEEKSEQRGTWWRYLHPFYYFI